MAAASPAKPLVALVAGTRPEVVKLAPVWHALRGGPLAPCWISTGQHGALEEATLRDVAVAPDVRLEAPRLRGAGLSQATAALLAGLSEALAGRCPALVVVQGDTTSAFAAALAAFHAERPVAHVEAGLRSFDPRHPFPEEANRRMIAALAAVHLAPTPGAADHLVAEGVPRARVVVTGNPGVDAQRRFAPPPDEAASCGPGEAPSGGPGEAPSGGPGEAPSGGRDDGARTVVVTLHRRESWDAPLASMCDAVAELVDGDPSLRVVWPVHVQPRVARAVRERLAGRARIALVPPLGYRAFQGLLASADLALTDSGGIQEEAPEYGLPVLVLREGTERPEAVEHGFARVVGRSREAIVAAAREQLARGPAGRPGGPNPFGDGRAAERIATVLARFLAGETPLLRKSEAFA